MSLDMWLFVMTALGFVDGWLACWWVSILLQRRERADLERSWGEALGIADSSPNGTVVPLEWERRNG